MKNTPSLPIYRVTCSTAHVGVGSTFVAIAGFKADGADFIPEAVEKGATEIVVIDGEKGRSYAARYPHIVFHFVSNPRRELSLRAAAAYGYPAQKLKLIGVTGTKGKTTTTFLIHHILKTAGFKTALLGSVKNSRGEYEEQSTRATMGADYLHHFFNMCVQENISHVVIEVSSHALELDRTFGLVFDAAVFTNLAAEHLDLHGSIEEYFAAKSLLFDQIKPGGIALINVDNVWGHKLYTSLKTKNTLQLTVLSEPCEELFKAASLFGLFNTYNIAAASLLSSKLGISSSVISQALATFGGVPGRMNEHMLKNGARAFVDHAHEPFSFETALAELRKATNHLIVIFGCGEGRKYKRAGMGKTAARYADVLILTDDNPREDDPQAIVADILEGISAPYRDMVLIEHDRSAALRLAVSLSRPGSIVALLGKGHETYQVIGKQSFYWNDYEEISKY